jgi:RHS repeat-associated protein
MQHSFSLLCALLAASAWGFAPAPRDFTFVSTKHFPTNGQNTFTIVAENTGNLGRVTNVTAAHLPTPITVTHDLNGNLTFDGLRSFAYDAENQLTNVSVAGQWQSQFVYDGLGRKRIERDYSWTGSVWQQTNETRFIYDGMLVLQERGSNNAAQVTYTRGLDLSATRQGAGGIGGLLARTHHSATPALHYFLHTDGAGNVTALMDAGQHIVARYLYDPFGRQLGQWGELATANRYRFSSKEVHNQSGLYYYGFRHYDPALQRWLTEDPMGERGGINLYGFVGNSPLNAVDSWGLAYGDWWDPRTYLPGYARLRGMNDLDAFAKNNNYQNYEDMFLSLNEDDPFAQQRLAGENLRAVGDVAEDIANGYLTAATAVTPTAAGTRCAARLTQQGLEHVAERHLFASGAKNAGKYAEGIGARAIRDMVNEAIARGTSTPGRFGRTVFEHDFGRLIGTDIAGNPASRLRVVVEPNGDVVTAFPIK